MNSYLIYGITQLLFTLLILLLRYLFSPDQSLDLSDELKLDCYDSGIDYLTPMSEIDFNFKDDQLKQ
jgi:hypothetical protein